LRILFEPLVITVEGFKNHVRKNFFTV